MAQVTIKILTTQQVDGQRQQMKTVTHGNLIATDETYVLDYTLTDDEGTTSHTTLTVYKTCPKAVMVNSGTMVIEQGKEHIAPYRMGPYEMELGVIGKAVLCRLTPTGGNVKLQYTLTINGVLASDNTVELFAQ